MIPAFLITTLSACAGGGLLQNLTSGLQSDEEILEPEISDRYLALQQAVAPAMQAVVEDRERRDLLLFSHKLGDVSVWYGRDDAEFAMRDGMLVSTRGISGDLMAADVRQSAALVHGKRNGQAKRFHSYLNGNNQIETRSYVCDIRVDQQYTLELPGRTVPTWYIVEDCVGPDFSFENYYWVDRRSGRIWQSRQLANPFSGLVAFQVVP